MLGCKVDPNIERKIIGEFRFPLGAYPVAPITPKAGYTVRFEPADGNDHDGEWEEWPDRYFFDAVLSAERVPALCRTLLGMMPGRVFPILDILGQDAYREIDPYISYELVGLDNVLDQIRRFHPFFYEDGLVGFGAMSEEPFFYVFVDEHKIVTIRVEPTLKDKVERILHAFDLEAMEEPKGADAAAHEHRSVLLMPDDDPSTLGVDEVVERLRDEWRLLLNIDPEANVDDDGNDLGVTPWRILVRCEWDNGKRKYAEVLVDAPNLRQAEETAFEATDSLITDKEPGLQDLIVVAADRLEAEQLSTLLARTNKARGGKRRQAGDAPKASRESTEGSVDPSVHSVRWLPE